MSKVSVMAADGGQFNEPWMPAALGASATFSAGVLVWLAQRLVGKGALQASLNQGFSELMTELRAELVATRTQRDEFKALLVTERAERHAEREAWRAERTELNGKINNQDAALQSLERLLKSNGTLPDLPDRKTPPEPVQVVETTLRQDGIGE